MHTLYTDRIVLKFTIIVYQLEYQLIRVLERERRRITISWAQIYTSNHAIRFFGSISLIYLPLVFNQLIVLYVIF